MILICNYLKLYYDRSTNIWNHCLKTLISKIKGQTHFPVLFSTLLGFRTSFGPTDASRAAYRQLLYTQPGPGITNYIIRVAPFS